jgi:hypothetical protein
MEYNRGMKERAPFCRIETVWVSATPGPCRRWDGTVADQAAVFGASLALRAAEVQPWQAAQRVVTKGLRLSR